MTKTVTVAPVRKKVRVDVTPERAFEIFTAGMTRWWSKQYSINSSPIRDIVIEPRANGRWFERGEDGSECQWGKVLAWEPPSRLLLAWQITPSWTYDPNLVTEVEIRFVADGTGARVELEHRLDGYDAAAEGMFKVFDGGWQGLLESFAQEGGRAA
jgi:uncharacterized protein YndB with AHSA1/START domain